MVQKGLIALLLPGGTNLVSSFEKGVQSCQTKFECRRIATPIPAAALLQVRSPTPAAVPDYYHHCCTTDCDQHEGVHKCKKIDDTPILNIGNSYTYANLGVNDALCSLLSSAGYSTHCGRIAHGGWTLSDHWESYNYYDSGVNGTPNSLSSSSWYSKHCGELAECGRALLDQWRKMSSCWSYQREFQTKKGGFVIIQDASYRPAYPARREISLPALKGLNKQIEARGATTVLYSTWGSRDHFTDPKFGNEKVGEGYEHYALSISSRARKPLIAPVGRAFGLIYDEVRRRGGSPMNTNSDFYLLYHPDGSHPSNRGTYLAACVMFCTITGQNSTGKSSWRLSTKDAEALQAKADQAVFQDL